MARIDSRQVSGTKLHLRIARMFRRVCILLRAEASATPVQSSPLVIAYNSCQAGSKFGPIQSEAGETHLHQLRHAAELDWPGFRSAADRWAHRYVLSLLVVGRVGHGVLDTAPAPKKMSAGVETGD